MQYTLLHFCEEYNKPRPVIVKFNNYKDKINVFKMNKNLKRSGVTIEEDFTQENLKLCNVATEKYGHLNAWTKHGSICVKKRDGIVYRKTNKSEQLKMNKTENKNNLFCLFTYFFS